jgi:hypothetical protein
MQLLRVPHAEACRGTPPRRGMTPTIYRCSENPLMGAPGTAATRSMFRQLWGPKQRHGLGIRGLGELRDRT